MVGRRTVWALFALVAVGCGEEPPREWALIAELRPPFDRLRDAQRASGGSAAGGQVSWLTGSWAPPEENGVWMLGAQGALVTDLPPATARLIIESQTNKALHAAGQTVQILINGELLGEWAPPDWSGVSVDSFEIPAEWLSPSVDRITLKAKLHMGEVDSDAPRDFALFLRSLRLFSAEPSKPARPVSAAEELLPRSKAPLPDLLVIVMDAARADHLSCYGYPRKTTPYIDKLAADGILFDQVFSTASYTRPSMASFLTGVDWFEHGIAEEADRLPDSVASYVERLSSAGYNNLGISESPQLSHASGADRGFDLFVETWTQADVAELAASAGYDLLGATFDRVMAAHLDERPTFTLVHMIPPHAPYDPTEQHDLWRPDDASLDSRIVGSRRLDRIHRGEVEVDDDERGRIVQLYDGNLHRADAMVKRLVESWKALDRSRPLRILVLSDHGEALGERGHYGHNTTLYDQMTRIPAILWPRKAFVKLRAESKKIRSIQDLLALLCSDLGVLPEPRARQRVFFRSLNQIGARDMWRLGIFDRWNGPMEFDLARDPKCERNLWSSARLSLPDWLVEFGQESHARGFHGEAAASELSDVDRERLESLGYTQ